MAGSVRATPSTASHGECFSGSQCIETSNSVYACRLHVVLKKQQLPLVRPHEYRHEYCQGGPASDMVYSMWHAWGVHDSERPHPHSVLLDIHPWGLRSICRLQSRFICADAQGRFRRSWISGRAHMRIPWSSHHSFPPASGLPKRRSWWHSCLQGDGLITMA